MLSHSHAAANGIPLLGFGTYPLTGEEAATAPSAWRSRSASATSTRRRCMAMSTMSEAPCALPAFRAASSLSSPKSIPAISARPALHRRGAIDGRSWRSCRLAADSLAARRSRLRCDPRSLDGGEGEGHGPRHRRQQFHPGDDAPRAERAQGAIICNQVEFHPLLDQSKLLATAGTRHRALRL